MQDLYKNQKLAEDLNQIMKTKQLIQQTKTQPRTANRRVPINEISKYPVTACY